MPSAAEPSVVDAIVGTLAAFASVDPDHQRRFKVTIYDYRNVTCARDTSFRVELRERTHFRISEGSKHWDFESDLSESEAVVRGYLDQLRIPSKLILFGELEYESSSDHHTREHLLALNAWCYCGGGVLLFSIIWHPAAAPVPPSNAMHAISEIYDIVRSAPCNTDMLVEPELRFGTYQLIKNSSGDIETSRQYQDGFTTGQIPMEERSSSQGEIRIALSMSNTITLSLSVPSSVQQRFTLATSMDALRRMGSLVKLNLQF